MTISSFSDDYDFLSNFFQRPFSLPKGTTHVEWPDVEHAFQAMKATNQKDYEHIRSAPTAAEAKKRGRAIKARDDWENVKREVMLRLLLAKFHDPDLRKRLAATAPHALIEGNNWHDNYWGRCTCGRPSCDITKSQNYLGRTLQAVRLVLC